MDKGIVGIDLAGNEADFPAEPFQKLFSIAQEQGLQITIHAGEWGGADNVRKAIEDFGAERIGHGIREFPAPTAARAPGPSSTDRPLQWGSP